MEKNKIYYTYFLRCSDGSIYCGYTNNIDKRLMMHNNGKGAKYTRSRRPVKLVYYEVYTSKQDAMRREAALKKLTHKEKKILISMCSMEDKDEETFVDRR